MNIKGYNLATLGIHGADERIAPGQVALANESAFQASFQSEPLTGYALGWKSDDGKLEKLLDFLAPPCRVARRFDYRTANNGDQFAMIADDADVRALYGEYKMVKTLGDLATGKTVSKGFSTVIERDSEMPGERENKVAWLKRMLLKAEIYRAWTLLNAASSNTAKTWNSSAHPDSDLRNAIEAFGDAVGIDANRILFGSTSWTKRMGAYEAQDAKNFVPPATPAALADFLGVDECLVSKERYTSGAGKSRLVSANTVLCFQGQQVLSTEDSSTLKRFWTPKPSGGEWVVYVDEKFSDELVKITVAHTSQIATTCSTGVQKLTIS